jgi:hypothetical protein
MDVSRVLRIIAAFVCFAWVLGFPAPADAACVAPSVTVDHGSVSGGDVLEIRGSYFGTECNDDGESGRALGKPQAGILVRIVQGNVAFLLALVDANDDYRFVVQVTVPVGLAVGSALVTASSVRFREVADAIVITESAVPGAVFAPPTFLVGRDSNLPRIEPPEQSSNTGWIVAGVVVAGVAAAIGGVILYRWQQRRPYQWIQDPK